VRLRLTSHPRRALAQKARAFAGLAVLAPSGGAQPVDVRIGPAELDRGLAPVGGGATGTVELMGASAGPARLTLSIEPEGTPFRLLGAASGGVGQGDHHVVTIESCGGRDEDCDGALGEQERDADGDGLRPCDGDCDDGAVGVRPGAPEICDGGDGSTSPGAPAGNLSFEPGFSDWTADGDVGDDDFSLALGSPAIGAGNPDAAWHDPDGTPDDLGRFGGLLGDWDGP
jgi:hypothetical protein